MLSRRSLTLQLLKKVRSQDVVDLRYIEEMEKSGFFAQLWADKK